MNKINYHLRLVLTLFLLSNQNFAQSFVSPDSIVITPNKNYSLNNFSKTFLGEHWRELWTTPVKVEILNLKNFEGGLTVLKEGGGKQTKSLHLIDVLGNRWKFRSIDKDPAKILPDYLRESIAEDALQDQISSANPYAPLILPKLLEAVGVTPIYPKLVYFADDSSLGIHRNEFANLLGFIEPHPDESFLDETEITGAVKVKSTFDAIKEIEKNSDQKFASEEYLKARLIDILVGDWDRHMDQWRWVKASNSSQIKWIPIPRDRDQAFVKYDGLLPSLAAYYIPQLNHFGFDYPAIKDLTWNGRFLDSRVLTEMDKTVWDSLTSFVQSNITDSLIELAIKSLPPEVYDLVKNEIGKNLKNRRDKLKDASKEFYEVVNDYADIFCSRDDDSISVTRIDDKHTEVYVYLRNENQYDQKSKPYFHKIFDNDLTSEIRIYLNNGDDKAIVSGSADDSPIIRIIGGDGKDEMIDESIVNGYFLSITPFRATENKTYFYDSGKKTEIVYGTGTVYDDSKFIEPEGEVDKNEPPQLDKGHQWFPLPILAYDSDRGLTIGASLKLTKFGFRKIPFENQQNLSISYSTGFKKFTVTYDADFYEIAKNSYLNILLSGTEHFTTRYFGYGNETNFDKNLELEDYYDVNQELLIIRPTFNYTISNHLKSSAGISVIKTQTELNNYDLISSAKYGSYGITKLNPLGIHLGVTLKNIDNIHFPKTGYSVEMLGSVFPAVFNIPKSFETLDIDFRSYFTMKDFSNLTIALRTGARKVWGKYPFFAGAALGGKENLRGYLNKRFSGDASVFGQLELRNYLTDLKLILKSKLGVLAFAEAGRVFAVNETSTKWHPSYGFGLWLAYLDSTLVLNSYVAFSPENTIFSFGFELPF
jgi:hypothetical protein